MGETGDIVFNNFFFMLLSQKMYYANVKEIKLLIEALNSNKLFNETKKNKIPTRYIGFLKDIEESRYLKIRLLNLKTQARHKVAVLVKSILKR
jgi:hypothetical protein